MPMLPPSWFVAGVFGLLGVALATSLLLRLERRWRLRWWEVPVEGSAASAAPGGVYREGPRATAHLARVPSRLRMAACLSALPAGLLMAALLHDIPALAEGLLVPTPPTLGWVLPTTLACLLVPSWLLPRAAVRLLRREADALGRAEHAIAWSMLPNLIAVELLALLSLCQRLSPTRLDGLDGASSLFAFALSAAAVALASWFLARPSRAYFDHPTRYLVMGEELFEFDAPRASCDDLASPPLSPERAAITRARREARLGFR